MMDNKMEEFGNKLEKVIESAYRKLDKRTEALIERYKKMMREEMAEILSGRRIEAKPPSGTSPQDVSKTGVSESSVVKPRYDGDMTEQDNNNDDCLSHNAASQPSVEHQFISDQGKFWFYELKSYH